MKNSLQDISNTTDSLPNSQLPAVKVGTAFRRVMPSGGGRGPAAAAAPPARRPPLHNPNAPGALLLNTREWKDESSVDQRGVPVVAVVVDPYLGR